MADYFSVKLLKIVFVTKGVSPLWKVCKVFQKISCRKNEDFESKNMKKTESLKMTSKPLNELVRRSYEKGKVFSLIRNLAIYKNRDGNERKTNHEKLNSETNR